MRYFFLIYAIIALLVIGMFGFRGEKFSKPPLRMFPDMDEQDVVKAQKHEAFFADGMGSRQPVHGTQPLGFNTTGEKSIGGVPEPEFSGATGYYYTGHLDDHYANGMPAELGLTEKNVGELLRRGEERFNISCMPCHGKSGDGNGITSKFGVPGAANLVSPLYGQASYPDGRLFEVITKGKGNMSGYGYNVPVRDRWAIIAYVRALQTAKAAPYEGSVKAAFDAAKAAQSSVK